jgi:uncharacterized membrane protein
MQGFAAAAGGPPPAGLEYVPGSTTQFLGLDQKLGVLLGYVVGVLSLLYIFMEPKTNRFVRFHAFQAIFIGIAMTVVSIVGGIATAVLIAISPAMGLLGNVVQIANLVLFVFYWIAAYNGFQGKVYLVPMVGKMAANFASKD